MEALHFHYPAVFSAAVISFVIGGLWYSPILFSRAWMKACGITEAQARSMNVAKVFGLALLANLVMAFNLSAFLGAKATLQFGLFAGLATGLGWVAMSLGVIYLFEQRPFKLWLINSGYQVLTYTVMGYPGCMEMKPTSLGRSLSRGLVSGLAGLLVAAPTSQAATTAVSSSGFTSSFRAEIKATPAQAWAAIAQLPRWWNSSHTYSGNAANLSLDAQAGGCFCERWRDAAGASHSVQHAQVVLAQEGRVLRLNGAFGPLQDLAVVGVLTIVASPGVGADADKHYLRMTYRVAGGADAGLDKLAPVVDDVIGEQFKRLQSLIETGSAS